MIHRLVIELERVEPLVSRTLEIPSTWTLGRLCEAIQRAMGWSGQHLDEIRVGSRTYIASGDLLPGTADAAAQTIDRALGAGQVATYLYDYGDSWTHHVVVEGVADEEAGVLYPRCIAGAGACPPEDCGGSYGYAELLASRDDEESSLALGPDFDPNAFDLAAANRGLRRMVPVRVSGELEKVVRLTRQEKLPKKILEQLVARGAEVVPYLITLVEDERFWKDRAPGAGWSPIHAANVLGAIGDIRALDALAFAIEETDDVDDLLFNNAAVALAKLGPGVVELCLARLATVATDSNAGGAYLVALASSGVRDDRIYERLLEAFEGDWAFGAGELGVYGDPRALPVLSQALDEASSDDWELTEVAHAMLALGGTLSAPQRTKFEQALAERKHQYALEHASKPATRSSPRR